MGYQIWGTMRWEAGARQIVFGVSEGNTHTIGAVLGDLLIVLAVHPGAGGWGIMLIGQVMIRMWLSLIS